MRSLSERSRADLLRRCTAFLEEHRETFTGSLDRPVPTGEELRQDVERVRGALGREPWAAEEYR